MTLVVQDISFGYPGKRLLYEGFSLEVAPRERVALAAPSGAGKTTLCRIIAGFERPQSGKVLVDGSPLSRRGACPVQMIGQHPEHSLDPLMRMKNSLDEAGQADAGVLRALGIKDAWLSRYPHELSGGELQRFCIARALLANPRYLVADEISTMLDAVTQAQLWTLLLEEVERRELGLVFVSHSPALTARLATRVIELEPTLPRAARQPLRNY